MRTDRITLDLVAWSTEGGTRTLTPLRETDFESVASTIPPLRLTSQGARIAKDSGLRHLLAMGSVGAGLGLGWLREPGQAEEDYGALAHFLAVRVHVDLHAQAQGRFEAAQAHVGPAVAELCRGLQDQDVRGA
jgi:hypothetical protein